MDLECEINAYPEPRITWWKDGVELINNEHYKYEKLELIFYSFGNNVRAFIYFESILVFQSLTR